MIFLLSNVNSNFSLKTCVCTPNRLKEIKHIIQIDLLSDTKLIFWLSHIIEQKFQNQSAAKSSSFNLKIRKSHW